MIRLLPAVLIGGPPHPNKTMLFSDLTKVLRERNIPHHAVRVCSASQAACLSIEELAHIRHLSIRDADSDGLLELFSRELSQRILPVLIDMSIDHHHLQACILQHCTHLTFLLHEYSQASQKVWFQLAEHYGLLPLLDTYLSFGSTLSATTTNQAQSTHAFLNSVQGFAEYEPLFDRLVERITDLFSAYSREELVKIYIRQSPTALVLHLTALLQTLAPTAESWEPETLSAVLAYIPARTPLSVYGPGPRWLYAALAAYTDEADFYQFGTCFFPGDVSSSWVASPPLLLSTATRSEVHVTYIKGEMEGQLTVTIQDTSLDYLQASSLPFPPVPSHAGLILIGSMPIWLLTAIVRLYIRAGVSWIACRQAQYHRDVVVFSRTAQHLVGESIPLP